jgi:K+-sensing histidine kinase KdpD
VGGDRTTLPTDLVGSPDDDRALTLLARLGEQVEDAQEGALGSLVRPLLQLLGDLSGLEAVYLTSIDWEAGEQVIEIARNTAGEDGFEVPEGVVVPWDQTLCELALEQGGGWNVEVPTTWGVERPAAVEMGIQSFVSVPVQVEPGAPPAGTLCGASPRRVEADPRVVDVLHLFARMIATAIQRDGALEQAGARLALAEERLAGRIRFAAQVEHAMKSPITAVLGWVHNLRRGGEDPDLRAKGLDAIAATAERLAAQVTDLLAEARSVIGAGKPEDVDVRHLADDAAALADSHDYSVDGRLRLHAEPTAVGVLLEHLVENAVTHTPTGTAIRVLLDDGRCTLTVEDDGPGLPDRDDLFEPFVSADPDVRGTGLGLHIIASIVEHLDAELETGASPSGGACFTVRF